MGTLVCSRTSGKERGGERETHPGVGQMVGSEMEVGESRLRLRCEVTKWTEVGCFSLRSAIGDDLILSALGPSKHSQHFSPIACSLFLYFLFFPAPIQSLRRRLEGGAQDFLQLKL